MSEYARRNLVCSSWHKAPEGFLGWSGMSGGATRRPFCSGWVGHAGDHRTVVYRGTITTHRGLRFDENHESQELVWPNKLGMPEWLVMTTIHGLRMFREHTFVEDQTECEKLDMILEPLLEGLIERIPEPQRTWFKKKEEVA